MSTPNSSVRIGTMKMPLAMPSTPPSALAPKAATNSQRMVDVSIEATSGLRPRARTPGQSSSKPYQFTTVVKLFVINRPLPVAVGDSFDEENGIPTSTPKACATCSSAVEDSSWYWASSSRNSYLSLSRSKIGSASRYLERLLRLVLVTDCYI